MGMSTHIVGFQPADDKWKQMKSIYDACKEAKISIPDEVQEFFSYEDPGDKPGMEIELADSAYEWSDDYRSGFEVDISKLPENVKFIRFYNSW